jgi:hypothetical protein
MEYSHNIEFGYKSYILVNLISRHFINYFLSLEIMKHEDLNLN